VLSSHSPGRTAPWRRTSRVAVLALAAVLPAGVALRATSAHDHPPARASSAALPSTGTPDPEGVADLVALVRHRCPQVRRLRLADLGSSDFLEAAPCPTRGGTGTVRFARIAQVLGTGVEVTTWVELDAERPHSQGRTVEAPPPRMAHVGHAGRAVAPYVRVLNE
jgi:hypothetical protein